MVATMQVPEAGPEHPIMTCVRGPDAAKEVKALLASGIEANVTSGPFEWTPLHEAAGLGKVDVMQTLLDSGAKVDARAIDGETPVHIAAQQGEAEAIQVLFDSGADLTAVNDDGETPLHVAVQHIGGKDKAAIELLIRLRSDPSACDEQGRSATAMASLFTNRSEELVKILSDGSKPVPSAAEEIAASARRSCGDAAQISEAVRVACKKNQVDALRQLLTWMPSQDSVIEAAQGALASAAGSGHIQVIKALLEARAELSRGGAAVECTTKVRAGAGRTDDMRTTPLIAAAGEGSVKMVRWLLGQGCEVNAQASDGATALMAAAIRGSSDSCDALLEARADVDRLAGRGWTALMASSHAGNVSATKTLLDARADISISSAEVGNARDLAVANGRSEVVKMLDQRATLIARQQLRSAAATKEQAAEEDTRDLDALLNGLEDSGGGSAGRTNNKKSKKKKGPSGEEPNTSSEPAVAHRPPATAAKTQEDKTMTVPVSGTPGKEAATEAQTAPADAKTGSKKASAVKKNAQSAQGATDAAVLRARLKEIEAERAKLDAEELKLRRQLDKLGNS